MEDQRINFDMAIHWTCPSCGKSQFRLLVPAELRRDERSEMLTDHGIKSEVLTSFISVPRRVRCRRCKAKFRTESF